MPTKSKKQEKPGFHWHRNPDGAWSVYYGVAGNLHLMLRVKRVFPDGRWLAVDGDPDVVRPYSYNAYYSLNDVKRTATEIVNRKLERMLYELKWIDIATMTRAGRAGNK